MRYKIIVNPVSGRGNGMQSVSAIEQQLKAIGLNFDLEYSQQPWHAADLACQASLSGYDAVVAVGGDGTVNEVINGLMRAKAQEGNVSALGVLCVGRGNDFAYGAGIPSELQSGCEALARASKNVLDIGKVTGGDYPDGRYFGNGVGIGFDAVVGFEALKMKRLQGFASYLVAALKTIFLYYHAPKVRIEYDSQELEINALMVSIMNGKRMGGGFMMAPFALTDDSLFDLCIATQVSKMKIFTLIPKFMKGSQSEDPSIRSVQTRHVSITALDGSLPAHSDGETLCHAGKSLTLEILPRALEIIRP